CAREEYSNYVETFDYW
nr:immunoglobulin heavy chain junction region [Macaca mulatta]MOW96480.1 immunoglobulin heavy chain junction region [Macaca mulatta]